MSIFSKYPSPIREIMESSTEGRGAIVLEGNTTDRIICETAGLAQPMGMAHAILTAFNALQFHLGHISATQGFTPVYPPNDSHAQGKSPFPKPAGTMLENPAAYIAQFFPALENREQKKLLFIDGIDLQIPEIEPGMMNPDQLRLMLLFLEFANRDAFRQSGNILVLSALQGSINRGLMRSGAFRRITVPLPPEGIRKEFIQYLRQSARYAKAVGGIEIDKFARISNGCRLSDIEGLARKYAATAGTISEKDINEVKQKAILDVSQGQLGVIIPSKTMADVIGNEKNKEFFEYQAKLAASGSASMASMVIMEGVPGVGKTHSVEAYASLLGWTLLEWRNIRSMWVGQSEARCEQALEIIRQNAPCLVWVDECDQMLGGRSVNAGDGGVDARIFGMILAATGDASMRGKVQWLMATNRPDILDPALADRAGGRAVFLTPSAKDREQLLPYLAEKQGRKLDEKVDMPSLVIHPNLEMASVRNLIEIIGHAGMIADLEQRTANASIGHEHLLRAIEEFNPGDTLETEFIALHSINHLKFLSQLPWIGPDGKILPGYQIPRYLEGIVDPASGRPDPYKLIQRLRERESLRAQQRAMR